jgi:hypothetical protein
MNKVAAPLVALVLAATLSFAPAASAHDEEHEANEARSEHFLGVNWDAPWMSRALVVGGLAVVGVADYTMQHR